MNEVVHEGDRKTVVAYLDMYLISLDPQTKVNPNSCELTRSLIHLV
jgi:hypothetical protein